MTLYQFLPYPENKPGEIKIYTVIAKERATNREFESRAYWNGERWDGGNILSFLAPIPADPDDEKAAEAYIVKVQTSSASIDPRRDRDKRLGFLAGCAHKAGEVDMLRKQLEESLLLYNNMTHNITTLTAENERLLNDLKNNIQKSRDLSKACDLLSEENERLKADNAKYGDMASALSKAGQEIERLRQALNQ